jgi:hypothetical protein
MEFYSILIKLLLKANELQTIDIQKQVNQADKVKNNTKFIGKLNAFIYCEIENRDETNFIIYFIKCLKDIINDSLSLFCENKKEITINSHLLVLFFVYISLVS